MESLKDKAILMLIENCTKQGEIVNIGSYNDYFETVSSFVLYDKLDEAKKILDYICKFQTKKGDFQFKRLIKEGNFDDGRKSPILFLKVLNDYFKKANNKKEVMRYSSEIKKSLNYLEEHFDKIYILFYSFDKNGLKEFSAKTNMLFLSFAAEFSDLLNEHNLNKDGDIVHLFKTKIELGVQRYFYIKEEKIVISTFKPEIKKYKVINTKNVFYIVLNYNLEEPIERKILENLKLSLKSENDMEIILKTLLFMKQKKDKNFIKSYMKYKQYLEFFPKKILLKKNFNLKVKNSLFMDFKVEVKEFEKEKIILVDLNQIKIANLVLKLENI